MIDDIQRGVSADEIQRHLAYYHQLDENRLREDINVEVEGYPAIFYVVETDNAHMIRHWIKYGGDPNATCGQERFPLLAFAILHGTKYRTNQQRTAVVELLLTLGASPNVIPEAFYTPFDRKLPASGPEEEELIDIMGERQSWCVARLRRELVSALNLTQRYRLSQASKIGPVSRRQHMLVSRTEAERILGLQYTVIGQYHAVKTLKRRILV